MACVPCETASTSVGVDSTTPGSPPPEHAPKAIAKATIQGTFIYWNMRLAQRSQCMNYRFNAEDAEDAEDAEIHSGRALRVASPPLFFSASFASFASSALNYLDF